MDTKYSDTYSSPLLILQASSRNTDTAQTRLQSNAADNALWQSVTTSSHSQPFAIRTAIERVEFVELERPTPLREVLIRVQRETERAVQEKLRAFVITGRARGLAEDTCCAELERLLHSEGPLKTPPEVRETIGDIATAFVVSGNTAGVLVVQSAET